MKILIFFYTTLSFLASVRGTTVVFSNDATGAACLDMETQCGSGCCPHSNATCCDKTETCCREGTICLEKLNICLGIHGGGEKSAIPVLRTEKSTDLKANSMCDPTFQIDCGEICCDMTQYCCTYGGCCGYSAVTPENRYFRFFSFISSRYLSGKRFRSAEEKTQEKTSTSYSEDPSMLLEDATDTVCLDTEALCASGCCSPSNATCCNKIQTCCREGTTCLKELNICLGYHGGGEKNATPALRTEKTTNLKTNSMCDPTFQIDCGEICCDLTQYCCTYGGCCGYSAVTPENRLFLFPFLRTRKTTDLRVKSRCSIFELDCEGICCDMITQHCCDYGGCCGGFGLTPDKPYFRFFSVILSRYLSEKHFHSNEKKTPEKTSTSHSEDPTILL